MEKNFEFPSNATTKVIMSTLKDCRHPSELSIFKYALNKLLSEKKTIQESHLKKICYEFQHHVENKYDDPLDLQFVA